MVLFNILSGKKAGGQSVVRHFPFRVGRGAQNDLPLDDDGVWEQQFTVELRKGNGFNLAVAPNALVSINNQPVQSQILRNGDVVTFGSVKLQFWLAAARQRSVKIREDFVWTLLIAVTIGQFALIYWLLK